MIGRMTGASEMKESLSLGAAVAVDQHSLRAALAGLATIYAALAAGTKARVIGPWPVDLRRLAVILLEAGAHFALELFLQAERRRHDRVGIGALGLEQRPDIGWQATRVAQHFAPIVGPHPGIIVHPQNPVCGERHGPGLGSGRRGDRGLRASSALQSLAGHDAGARPARGSAWKAAGTCEGASQRATAPAARSSSPPPKPQSAPMVGIPCRRAARTSCLRSPHMQQ